MCSSSSLPARCHSVAAKWKMTLGWRAGAKHTRSRGWATMNVRLRCSRHPTPRGDGRCCGRWYTSRRLSRYESWNVRYRRGMIPNAVQPDAFEVVTMLDTMLLASMHALPWHERAIDCWHARAMDRVGVSFRLFD